MSARPAILATLDGFAVEGGFDQQFGPSTCYQPAIALGQCATPGAAAQLWEQYEQVLDLVPALGLGGVRLTLEWARVEPRRGQRSELAMDRYRRALAHAKALGLRTTVVVIDAVWPAWLGPEAWLLPWTAPLIVAHADWVAEELPGVDGLISFARPRELIATGFQNGSAPPWRRGAGADARTAELNLATIMDEIHLLASWRGRTVTSFRELPVVASKTAIKTLLADAHGVDEIHLRSLVRGGGPTAAAAGLVSHVDGQWRVAVDESVRALWS